MEITTVVVIVVNTSEHRLQRQHQQIQKKRINKRTNDNQVQDNK